MYGLTGRIHPYSVGRIADASLFLSIVTAISAALYYLPDYYFLESVIAQHSAIFLHLIGIDALAWFAGHRAFVNEFEISRMCTGIQVVAVFIGLLAAMPKVSMKRKVMAVTLVAGSVYGANIVRIGFEIWLLYNGILPWDLAHYPTGLILGIFSVAFLIVAADRFIPEIGDTAVNIFESIASRVHGKKTA